MEEPPLCVQNHADAPSGVKVCSTYIGVVGIFMMGGSILVGLAPGMQTCQDAVADEPSTGNLPQNSNVSNISASSLTTGGYAIAAALGELRTENLEACTLVVVAFFCVIMCTLTAALVATFKPQIVERDFVEKGTLSNLCQDVTTPRGRIFATMLFTAGVLSIVSGYSLHIYPSWFPRAKELDSYIPLYQGAPERLWRTVWAAVPNVGLMYTALLPSLSNNEGTNIALTIIHNISAPLSLAFAVIMETVQLYYGENAFTYFFCTENATWDGPLSTVQRLRVVILCYAWIAALSFLAIQVYLGLGSVFGMKIKTSYCLALTSLFLEISSLVIAYALPALQAIAILQGLSSSTVLEEAGLLEKRGIVKKRVNALIGKTSLLESIAQPPTIPDHFLQHAQRAKHVGQIRTGFYLTANGQPMF